MKKVFVMAYLRKNFGDDLFVKMLLEKYKNIDFYIKSDKDEFVDILDKYDNLHVLYGKDTDEELYNSDVNEYDAYIYIGGSIFMEGGSSYNLSEKFYDFVKRCKENNKPFCYISCNYGPYQTQEYFELSQKDFKECTDICFRDRYSYNLFSDIESVELIDDADLFELCEIEGVSRVMECINMLSETQKDVIIMYYLYHRSIKEISELFGISEVVAESRWNHGRERLMKLLTRRGVYVKKENDRA
jgi:colanic acid/amylovoran biosynthesis protein